MRIILFGFPRCGKTYFGKRLARLLSKPFIDTDEEVGSYLDEISFRNQEHEVVKSLQGRDDAVISLGGGTILFDRNASLLQEMGKLIYLVADKNVLQERVLQKPLVFMSSFEKLYQERIPIYEKVPAVRVTLHGKSDAEVLEELFGIVKACWQAAFLIP